MRPSIRRFGIRHGLPAGWETIRAFVLFGLLLAALGAVAFQVAFRDLSRLVQVHRMNLGHEEAAVVAEIVRSIGRDSQGVLDYSRVRSGGRVLDKLLRERLAASTHVRFVEIRDRFGGLVLSTAPDPEARSLAAGRRSAGTAGVQLVVHPIRRGVQTEGEIRLGISEDAIAREVADLRRGLRLKVAVASVLAVAILGTGLAYVLFLIRKNRRLEESKLAAERSAYKGLLASGLAHEIRNPLNAMKMNLQMLEEELQGVSQFAESDLVDLLVSTQSEIKRLENLVNNFLLFARPSPPKFAEIDLNDVLRETATFLAADFRKTGVDLTLEPEPLLPSADADAGKIKQALMNILVNARQVLKPGGRVVLRSRPSGAGEVIVEIEDDGPGMSPETAAKIFDPFFSQRAGGTGLGLPIAKLMIEQHRGSIEVETHPGRGTIFRVRLPRRAAAEAASVREAGEGAR
jgi:signal transduction histidine kinase